MKSFKSIEDINNHLQISPYPSHIPSKLVIGEKAYIISNINNQSLDVSVHYTHLNETIIIEYTKNDDLQYVKIYEQLDNAVPDEIVNDSNPVDVGFECDTIIHGFNNDQPIHSKIDTGADMCSLHGTNIVVSNNIVQFEFNNKRYNIGLVGQQQVKQAGSDPTSRPIIKLNLTIQDQTLKNVECNISDRSNMVPLLIGKNVLAQHNFIIHTQTTAENLNNV